MPNGTQYACECGNTEFEVWSLMWGYGAEFTLICTRCNKEINEYVEG